jgi:carbonic anhydrase/acetyltransferase-like protein (isoleucine patch superfamily)
MVRARSSAGSTPLAATLARASRAIREELTGSDLRWFAVQTLTRPVPIGMGTRYRARVMRALGYRVGRRTTLMGNLVLVGAHRAPRFLTIGADCFINVGCLVDITAPVTIGDNVSFGHEVVVLTTSHDQSLPTRRAGALQSAPVTIGDGAWVAARAVLLPGVVVGEGAIVCAGAVVTQSVDPHTMVGGVPARRLRDL